MCVCVYVGAKALIDEDVWVIKEMHINLLGKNSTAAGMRVMTPRNSLDNDRSRLLYEGKLRKTQRRLGAGYFRPIPISTGQ